MIYQYDTCLDPNSNILRPGESTNDKYYETMIIDVQDITATSAVVEWLVPDDEGPIDSFTVPLPPPPTHTR